VNQGIHACIDDMHACGLCVCVCMCMCVCVRVYFCVCACVCARVHVVVYVCARECECFHLTVAGGAFSARGLAVVQLLLESAHLIVILLHLHRLHWARPVLTSSLAASRGELSSGTAFAGGLPETQATLLTALPLTLRGLLRDLRRNCVAMLADPCNTSTPLLPELPDLPSLHQKGEDRLWRCVFPRLQGPKRVCAAVTSRCTSLSLTLLGVACRSEDQGDRRRFTAEIDDLTVVNKAL